MSDDMGDKIKQIADMLGQNSNPNIPDNVKGLLSMLMSNTGTKDETAEEEPQQTSRAHEKTNNNDSDDFADMARKMKKAMGMLNTGNDPRVNLLNAIRPYLNKNRQRKLQTCIKLMRIGSLTQLLDDSEERPV
ncbi:MAG: hypothetical protein K0R50_1206 [Eubacterium sp.]|jgi:metal-dependent amidase/aminoacylase/carboxypeptidase family protein|nr:hypothetical protein [Eubacterium sp.]